MKTLTVIGICGLSLPMLATVSGAESPALDLAPMTPASVRVHVSTTHASTAVDESRSGSGEDFQSKRVQEIAHPPLVLAQRQPAGLVAEVIVNPAGEIEYVVARYRHQNYLIPYDVVQPAADGLSVELLMTPEEFQRLPRFFAHRWPAFNSRAFRDTLHTQFAASLDHPEAALSREDGTTMAVPADAGQPSNDPASLRRSEAERPSLNLRAPVEPMPVPTTSTVIVAPVPSAPVAEPAAQTAPMNAAAPQFNVLSGTAPRNGVRSLLFNPAPRFGGAVPNTAAGGVMVPAGVNGQGNALPGGAVGNPGFAPGGGTSTVRSPQAPPTIIGQPGGVVVPNAGTNNATGTGSTNRFPAAAPRVGSGTSAAGNTTPANARQGTPGGAPIAPSASPSPASGGNAAAGSSPQ